MTRLNRIVSLVPSITEILYFLKLEDKIVGVTGHCKFPKEAVLKEKIGTFLEPSVYKILQLKPDIVIADGNMHKKVIDTIANHNIKVLHFTYSTVNDIFESMFIIDRLCCDKSKKVSINNLIEKVNNIKRIAEQKRRCRVLFIMSSNPCITPANKCFQYDALSLAGAELMKFNTDKKYVKVDIDEIKEFDPEIILFCGIKRGETPPKRCKRCSMKKPLCQRTCDDIITEEWQNITAVKQKKIYPISCDMLCKPGPRLFDGMEKINKLL